MILKNKRDTEAWIKEQTLESMKQNPYVENGDIFLVAEDGNFYEAVSSNTNIPLQNSLFAKIKTVNINGNVSSAEKLKTARKITLHGDVEGNVDFDGSTNVSLNATVKDNSHQHDNSTIQNLDASKITSGTIDIARLPAAALERLVEVETDASRFQLTKSQVQLGDTVKVKQTLKMYKVIDENKLNSEAGYTVYVAGRAAEVPWAGVTEKPTTMPNPNPLNISLNGVAQGPYNGETVKNINITPSSIGAAAISHGTHVTYGNTIPKQATGGGSVGTSANVAREDHVHIAQTDITGNSGTATKLQTARKINNVPFDGTQDVVVKANTNNALTVKLNGASQGAFDGSAAKEINITPGSIGAEPTINKANAFNKNFGTTNDTILEGNKLAELLGATYEGILNNNNQKKINCVYYDNTTKQFYKCIKEGTTNYADQAYFSPVSMKSLSDRLDNLYRIAVSKINEKNKWFRLAIIENVDEVFGPIGLLRISFTRNNAVGHVLYSICSNHHYDVSFTQLLGSNYTQFKLRIYTSNYGHSLAIEILDDESYSDYAEPMNITIQFLNLSTVNCTIESYVNDNRPITEARSDLKLIKTVQTTNIG